MPSRRAFSLGAVVIVPSRAESLPYVVLEAAAAGKTMIATCVGGIPEIYGPFADALAPPEDPIALAAAIARTLDDPAAASVLAEGLRQRVAAEFSAETMVDGVLGTYAATLMANQT